MASKGSSSGIEVVSSNSPAIPAFLHPLDYDRHGFC